MLLGSADKGKNSALKDILNSLASEAESARRGQNSDLEYGELHQVSEKVGLEDITSTLLLP
jgi:hypothetical protein